MSQTVFEPWNDPNAKPIIQFRNVTKRFGDFVAIDNQSFDIYEKEFFALLGPSGCGKTTMMRMLAGFETPTEGSILLNGQDIAPIPPNKRAVNMMFQSYALFPHLTVWDNIAFGLKRDGMPKLELAARVEEMLKLVLDAYIQRDADVAHAVIQRDEDVDQMYNTIFREFLTFMMEDPRNITPCMHLHFIAKNIERMGDHATSIAEQTVFMITGDMPDDDRPKGDTTAYSSPDTPAP